MRTARHFVFSGRRRRSTLATEFLAGSRRGGTKSQRPAILLQTDEGEYVLRIQGGNPFHDRSLEELVGKRIRARGQLHGYTLLMDDWAEA